MTTTMVIVLNRITCRSALIPSRKTTYAQRTLGVYACLERQRRGLMKVASKSQRSWQFSFEVRPALCKSDLGRPNLEEGRLSNVRASGNLDSEIVIIVSWRLLQISDVS